MACLPDPSRLYPDPPVAGWIGYRRSNGGRWEAVCRGVSPGETWENLFEAMRLSGPGHYDSIVLKDGERPPR